MSIHGRPSDVAPSETLVSDAGSLYSSSADASPTIRPFDVERLRGLDAHVFAWSDATLASFVRAAREGQAGEDPFSEISF